jgi:ABC-type sugar transport system ATPase subunit
MISMERLEGIEALLPVQNLVKSYGNHRAVDNVSYAICPGELVALLGENGAGKTTLLQTIVGLLSPDEGTIQNEKLSCSICAAKGARSWSQPTCLTLLSAELLERPC